MHRTRDPEKCENSLQIPADQGIFDAETGSMPTASATIVRAFGASSGKRF
jgi:hypothetical protein